MSRHRRAAWGIAIVLSLIACGATPDVPFDAGASSTGSSASGSATGASSGNSKSGSTSGGGAASGSASAGASSTGSTSSGSSSSGSGASASGSVAASGAGTSSGSPQGGADGGPRDAAVPFSFDGGFATGTPLKGVAFAESGTPCTDLGMLNLSWFYNWGGSTKCTGGPPFVPMVWGNWNTLTFVSSPQKLAAAGFNIVLGFNEPDNAGQSNMTVAQAIALWPQMIQPTFQRIGGPATSSAPTGMTWQDNFIAAAAAANLRVDFVAVHWYGIGAPSCSNVSLLDAYITWAEHFNKPVWLTEFSCDSQTAAVDKAFYDAAIVMFKNHKLLERYAWFETRSTGVFANATLIDPSGNLTPLGMDYAAAPATH